MAASAKEVLKVAKEIGMSLSLPLEACLSRARGQNRQRGVCFINGPPRSGTTLAYDLMTHCFEFAYVSNLANQLNRVPVLASILTKVFLAPYAKGNAGNYKNRYGVIPGWAAPSEGGLLWNRWWPRDLFLGGDWVRNVNVQHVRRTIAAISNTFDRPFLNKNVMHSVHMLLLGEIFPQCVFIHVHREPVTNIRSIIRARQDPHMGWHKKSDWWSVKPREWRTFQGKGLVEQAGAQVHFIHENIKDDATILGSQRVFDLSYEELCASPTKVLGDIGRFLKANSIPVQLACQPPTSLSPSPSRPLDATTEQSIVEVVSSFGPGKTRVTRKASAHSEGSH